ncbi:MAG: hypothetical protein Q9169_006669 [Polycauliona sp. 2 TL-2023]
MSGGDVLEGGESKGDVGRVEGDVVEPAVKEEEVLQQDVGEGDKKGKGVMESGEQVRGENQKPVEKVLEKVEPGLKES